MVSNTEDTFKDTVVTTDSALIISGVKEQIESRVKDQGGNLKITGITKDNDNSYTISYNDGFNGQIYIDGSNVVFKVNGNIQYSRQLDNSLTGITLISNFVGDIDDTNRNSIYFKITGKNIFSGKEYIIIPIDNVDVIKSSEPEKPGYENPNDPDLNPDPVDHAFTISCPTKNPKNKYDTGVDVNRNEWATAYGQGSVEITVEDGKGDIDKVYYYNYSTYDDNYVNEPIDLKNDQISSSKVTFNITNAMTNTIKVYATDKEGNVVSKECVTNVDTIRPYTPTIHVMQDSEGKFYSETYLNIVENTCCIVISGERYCKGYGNNVVSTITTKDEVDTECYIKYGDSRNSWRGWCDDKETNIKRDGVSGWFSYEWKIYRNGTYIGTETAYLDSNDDWVKKNRNTKSYDKVEFTGSDVAGNKSHTLTFYKK